MASPVPFAQVHSGGSDQRIVSSAIADITSGHQPKLVAA
jgi:hypothetical protein